MRIIILVYFFLGWSILSAQKRPNIFPEDIETSTLNIKPLSQPGVKNKSRSRGLDIAYHFLGNSTLEPEDQPLSLPFSKIQSIQGLTFKLRLPIINQKAFKLILGYSYRPEWYHFERFGADFEDVFRNLNQRLLKSNSFSISMSKPLNEKYYTAFRFRLMYNGDYDQWINFHERYAIYNGVGLFGIKRNSKLEWGFGVNYSNSFRRTILLPFVFYNQNFSDKWGIEAILPSNIYFRYNPKMYSILLTGIEYNSRSYSMDVQSDRPEFSGIYNMNHSELRLIVSWERRLIPWLWLNIKGGFQLNFSTDFDAVQMDGTSFNVEPINTPFLQIGLFISPPDSFLN